MSDEHMWLVPFTEGQDHVLTIDLGHRTQLLGLRVWNYNKSQEDTFRGVKNVARFFFLFVFLYKVHLEISSAFIRKTLLLSNKILVSPYSLLKSKRTQKKIVLLVAASSTEAALVTRLAQLVRFVADDQKVSNSIPSLSMVELWATFFCLTVRGQTCQATTIEMTDDHLCCIFLM